jgi:hypothetical protein
METTKYALRIAPAHGDFPQQFHGVLSRAMPRLAGEGNVDGGFPRSLFSVEATAF